MARYVKEKITVREMDVLNVLWSSDKPMVASEIVKKNNELNINTVQAVLRSLLKKKYVEVVDIVYSGTVLSRSYRATDASRVELVDHFVEQLRGMSRFMSMSKLLGTMVENEKDIEVLCELNEIIDRRRKALQKGT